MEKRYQYCAVKLLYFLKYSWWMIYICFAFAMCKNIITLYVVHFIPNSKTKRLHYIGSHLGTTSHYRWPLRVYFENSTMRELLNEIPSVFVNENLCIMHIKISSSFIHQLFMCSHFNNFSPFYNADLLGIFDRRQAVCYYDICSVLLDLI